MEKVVFIAVILYVCGSLVDAKRSTRLASRSHEPGFLGYLRDNWAERSVSDSRRNALYTRDSEGNGQGRGPVAGCRGTMFLSDPGTIIQSPNYPDTYGDNLNCRWLIHAPEGSVIDLTFVDAVNIEEGVDGQCPYDAITVRDGENQYAPELTSICGTDQYPDTITTTGHTALVQFKTDNDSGESGFALTFDYRDEGQPTNRIGVCSGVTDITATSGTVTSPGYPNDNYGDNSDCGYRFTAPSGYVVQLQFTDVELEDEPSCLYDSISVYDGSSTSDPLGQVICSTYVPPLIISSGNSIYLQFTSDLSMNYRGFSLNWIFQQGAGIKDSPACGQNKPQILERSEGEFSSHGYGTGKNYPNNLDCAWRIIVSKTTRAHLHFLHFAMEPSSLCRYDQLYIYDGYDSTADQLGVYCGGTTPGDITASGNVIYLVLKTDLSVSDKGFHVNFSGKEKIDTGTGGTNQGVCGAASIEPKFGRIVGGQTAIPHSWPWQISMRNKDFPYSGGWGHWCGGSIISPDWIVTAAHCVEDNPSADQYRVIVGDHNRLESDSTEVTIAVEQVIMHESYNVGAELNNDIALFKLASSINYASEISPICLPITDIPDRTLCVTTGWGETKGTADNAVLQQVYVPTLPRAECNQADWYKGGLTQAMMCAGYPEGLKDSCQGDSGGPLVCSTGGPWTLQGITSWGNGCADAKKPGVYTRVTRFVDWIETKTGVGV